MKDDLEKFINEHRQEFDQAEPPMSVWNAIEKRIPKETKSTNTVHLPRWFLGLSSAAMIAVVLGVGLLIGLQLNQPNNNYDMVVQDFSEVQDYYVREANYMMTELNNKNAIDASLRADLQDIDAIFEELKEELTNNGSGDKRLILNAMLQTYENKVEILRKVLEKTENKTSEDNYKIFEDGKIEI